MKPLIESQQNEKFNNVMVSKAKTMLDLDRKIRRRLETRARLDETFVDRNDIDPMTGKGKLKKFIPKKVREMKMPLTHTKNVANDGRCASAYSAIETVLGRARKCHEAWK